MEFLGQRTHFGRRAAAYITIRIYIKMVTAKTVDFFFLGGGAKHKFGEREQLPQPPTWLRAWHSADRGGSLIMSLSWCIK